MRRLQGLSPHTIALHFWSALYLFSLAIALLVGLLHLQLFGVRLYAGPSEALLAATLCAVFLGMVARTVHVDVVWRWMCFWAFLGALVLIVTRDFRGAGGDRWHLATALCVIELATLCTWSLIHHLLPAIAVRLIGQLEVGWLWRLWRMRLADADSPPRSRSSTTPGIAAASTEGHSSSRSSSNSRSEDVIVALSYAWRLPAFGCVEPADEAAAHACTYRGRISLITGKPHGHGEWVDDSYHGENLRGVWTEGVPTGPFTTVEFGSGHVFSCVRCMFCASHGYPNDDTHLSTSRLPHGTLRFGVVAVECAVSGQYFFHFPHVRHLAVDDDDEAQSGGPAAAGHRGSAAALEACLPKPKPTADEERRDSKTVNEFFSMSDDVANRVGRCLRFLPTTTDFGSEVVVNNEAVVFIPGFNTPLDYACSRLGQLLALAKLPARFKPIVLSWPGGKAISYLSALKVASEPQTASTLLSLITALHTHGITTIHVLAHSMGARLLLHAIPVLRMAPLFASGAVRIPNVVLLAPDFPLETFVEHSSSGLAALGATATLYGDRHDRPLRYSETLGRWLPWVMPKEVAVVATGAQSSSSAGAASFAPWQSLGRLWGAPWAGCGHVDVIDTTWMQAGLPAGDPNLAVNTRMRHTHFAINQLVVDDLVELLTTGRRAEERSSRLRCRDGCEGIFHFFSSVPDD